MRSPAPLSIDPDDVDVLLEWIADDTAGRTTMRAQVLLLCAQGFGLSAVANTLGCSKQTVISWRERYRAEGLDGLRDAPRSGRHRTIDPAAVVLRTLEPPDVPGGRWSSRTLGADLGISNVAVANIWREWGLRPAAGGRMALTTDPVLDDPLSAVVGLYINPPLHLLAVTVTDQRFPEPAPPGQRPALGCAFEDLPSRRRLVGERAAHCHRRPRPRALHLDPDRPRAGSSVSRGELHPTDLRSRHGSGGQSVARRSTASTDTETRPGTARRS